jgi:hypothetical protein
VEVRDGVLQPSQFDWMSIFPLTDCLESMSIESQDMVGTHSVPMLATSSTTCRLETMSIESHDMVRSDALRLLRHVMSSVI